jgi:hypothetical protein
MLFPYCVYIYLEYERYHRLPGLARAFETHRSKPLRHGLYRLQDSHDYISVTEILVNTCDEIQDTHRSCEYELSVTESYV